MAIPKVFQACNLACIKHKEDMMCHAPFIARRCCCAHASITPIAPTRSLQHVTLKPQLLHQNIFLLLCPIQTCNNTDQALASPPLPGTRLQWLKDDVPSLWFSEVEQGRNANCHRLNFLRRGRRPAIQAKDRKAALLELALELNAVIS